MTPSHLLTTVMKRAFCFVVLLLTSTAGSIEEQSESRIINKKPLRTPASRYDTAQEEYTSPKAELSLSFGIQNHDNNHAYLIPVGNPQTSSTASLANFTFNAAILSRPSKQAVYFSSSPDYPSTRPASTYSAGAPCVGSYDWCVLDTNYPSEFVRNVVAKYQDLVQTLYSQLYRFSLDAQISYDNATHSYRDKGHFSCESEVRWVRLSWAKDWKGKWQLILNTLRYPQSIRMELCRYGGKRCEYLPPCYKSSCKQRNSQMYLIAMDPDKNEEPFLGTFFFPSACSCFVENFVYY